MKDILNKLKMSDCNLIRTPMEERLRLTKERTRPEVNMTYNKSLVGCLWYLTSTRPYIVYSVRIINKFMESPRQSNLQATKRILKYKKGIIDDCIFYSTSKYFQLVRYVDSDWAGDTKEGKSTSGYVYHFGS